MYSSSIPILMLLLITKGSHAENAACTCDKLLGDNSMDATYETKIKELLCRIPTYAARKYASDSQDEYKVCNAATISEFFHFPMPTQYYADKDRTQYLERMERCVEEEKTCNTELWKEINTLCAGVTTSDVEKLTELSELTMRNLKVYEFSAGSCKVRTLRRKSTKMPGVDDTVEPEFLDVYEPTNLNYPRLMTPYFEMYLLYGLDPKKKLEGTNIPDRWDEKKAFKELPYYLPQLMIHDMDTAIKCIYNRVNANQLKWDPTKFCELTSTFVCVDLSKLKGTDCLALGIDPHDITKKP